MRIVTNSRHSLRSTERRAPLRRSVRLAAALVVVVVAGLTSAAAFATDVTGTWNFSVDLGGGGKGNPVFSLKQTGVQVTGTYEGPLGKHNVTGRVTGNTIVIKLAVTRDDGPVTLTYTGKIAAPDSMSGSVNVVRGGNAMTGTWRATRKK